MCVHCEMSSLFLPLSPSSLLPSPSLPPSLSFPLPTSLSYSLPLALIKAGAVMLTHAPSPTAPCSVPQKLSVLKPLLAHILLINSVCMCVCVYYIICIFPDCCELVPLPSALSQRPRCPKEMRTSFSAVEIPRHVSAM